MRDWPLSTTAALGALALGIAACSSSPTNTNNCGSGAPPDLSGTYLMSSYTLGSQTWASPTSSGTLQVTASTYSYSMNLSTGTGSPQFVSDAGTYQLVGATCIRQTSSTDTTKNFSGSFVLQTASGATTFRESGSDGIHEVIWLWLKS